MAHELPPANPLPPLYDARGNRYVVITPQALRALGIELPVNAGAAMADRLNWATQAIAATCDWAPGERPQGARPHRCDGLLIGPFQASAPFDVLIVNTDGTLAERSGNGLTIFAQALTDAGRLTGPEPFTLRVHHDHASACSPMATEVTPQGQGFWINMGLPAFGPEAVQALPTAADTPARFSRVHRLAAIESAWQRSVFVRVGNPHCVTLLPSVQALPEFEALAQEPLHTVLASTSFAKGAQGSGEPCPAGVNLQWAALASDGRLHARIFERGEGATRSSGTSASAVAAAAWLAGWVAGGMAEVVMPGGTAPIRLVEHDGALVQVALLGEAQRV